MPFGFPPQYTTSHVCTAEGRALSPSQSALNLINVLAPNMDLASEFMESKPPVIILAYDEAHGMSVPKSDKPRAATVFFQHRRAIRGLRALPIFTLFLSTTGKIHDLTPPPKYDASDRLMNSTLRLLPPFSRLGFDQVVRSHASDVKKFGINDVSKVAFMVRFGRPL